MTAKTGSRPSRTRRQNPMAKPTPTPRTVARAKAPPMRMSVAEACGQSAPPAARRARCARIVDGLGKKASRSTPVALAHSHSASRVSGEATASQCSRTLAATLVTGALRGRSASRAPSALVGHGAHDLLAQMRPDLLEEPAVLGRGPDFQAARA